VLSGGTLVILVGGTFSGNILSGGANFVNVAGGGGGSGVVIGGQTLIISGGQTSTGVIVESSGTEIVLSGALPAATTCRAGAPCWCPAARRSATC